MHWLTESLRQRPELALFLVLAIGYGIGGLRLGPFKLGPILGVLIAGIAVGQLNIPVSETLKSAFFMFFLFAIGYRTGPQFFGSLRSTGLPQAVLALVVSLTAFTLSLIVAKLSGFDAGISAGLLGGAMTATPAFGAASDAIDRMNAPNTTRQLLLAHGAVSFAVCYLVGTVMVIWVLAKLGPWILRVNLVKACQDLEKEMGLPPEEYAQSSLNSQFVSRAYELPEQLDGKSVAELEAAFKGGRIFVERLRRDGQIIKPAEDQMLHTADRVALWGRREALIGDGMALCLHEVDDRELRDLGIGPVNVVIKRNSNWHTLGDLAREPASRGLFLEKVTRAGKELPYTLATPIQPGDVLTVAGDISHINSVVEKLGYVQQQTEATDIAKVSTAIFLGALIGLPVLAIGRVEVSLTVFVGVLAGGLALGWLSSLYPRFGSIPAPALWLFDSLGLAGFLALVGMQAGPAFVRGVQESGLLLVGAATLVGSIPLIVGMLVGRYIFRMHPAIALGACAGAAASAPALSVLLEASRSRIPALSYSVGYALATVILALAGAMIVVLIGPG